MDSTRYRVMMDAIVDRYRLDGNLATALAEFARGADLNVDRLNHRVKTRKDALRDALEFIPASSPLNERVRVLLKKSPKSY